MSTIFALATPSGKSGVAVIRISGAAAEESLNALGVSLPTPRKATLAVLRHNGEAIERALVLYFNAPHSFTGEEVVEIHCHGSNAVLRQLLRIFSTLPDYRMAEPGEFTRRAFLHGKLDLTAAEGLADLIDAETEAQRKQALRLMEGGAEKFYGELRRGILHSLAFLEAYIDFPDEDVPEHVLKEIDSELQHIAGMINLQLADNSAGEKIREGIYIAILGAPNVGKSSLLNLLAKRDAAIVSSIAGTTRDVIEAHLDIRGYPVILADTAGIREHADSIEQEGIRRSLERARTADIKIVVMDAGEEVAGCRLQVVIDQNTIILINKSDLANPAGISPVNGVMPIPFSVKERMGVESLMQAIEEKIAGIIPAERPVITRQRHRAHLEAALRHLQRYNLMRNQGIELRCEDLRRAAAEIGAITGRIPVDEVLGEIFSSFCIGK